jgi:hypothetical protein
MRVLIAIVISFLFFSNCGQKETQLNWAELRPILERLKLPSAKHPTEYDDTLEVEETDAKSYGPVSGVTLFLRTAEGRTRPRYWMRVEDYSTAEAAFKRAAEYKAAETSKRLHETSWRKCPDFCKCSLRIWAVARGKRVYALTTNALMFMDDSLPEELKAAISNLPEK